MFVYIIIRNDNSHPVYVQQHICSEACHICPKRFKCYTQGWVKLRSNGKPGVVFEYRDVPYGFLLTFCRELVTFEYDKIIGFLE